MKSSFFSYQFSIIDNLTDESKNALIKANFNPKKTINDSHKFPLCDASIEK